MQSRTKAREGAESHEGVISQVAPHTAFKLKSAHRYPPILSSFTG